MTNKQIQINKDLPGKKVTVVRNFDATVEQVWRAWTESNLLDQWWAPKPWKAETKKMDFTVGGTWLYAMVGPEGEKQWSRADFTDIQPFKSFSAADSFCDEEGNPVSEPPGMKWKNTFQEIDGGTQVTIEINFESEADLQKILEMGFEQGFTAALTNLDEYFRTQS